MSTSRSVDRSKSVPLGGSIQQKEAIWRREVSGSAAAAEFAQQREQVIDIIGGWEFSNQCEQVVNSGLAITREVPLTTALALVRDAIGIVVGTGAVVDIAGVGHPVGIAILLALIGNQCCCRLLPCQVVGAATLEECLKENLAGEIHGCQPGNEHSIALIATTVDVGSALALCICWQAEPSAIANTE